MGVGAGFIDQEGFGRAANAGATHFGIEQDLARHIERCMFMHIDMAHAIEMREDRHARFLLHAPDQTFAAARYNHVNIAVQSGQHHADRSTVGRVDNLHAIFIKTGAFQRAGKTAMNEACRI